MLSFQLVSCLVVLKICWALQIPLGFSTQDETLLDKAFNVKTNRTLEHYHVPGLAIAVVKGDEVFTKGYGVSNVETSSPVTEHTLFFGGSTSKAVTAAAISLLVDDDNYPEIQWDAPANSIIPEDFAMMDPWFTTHVTLRDILSHRSGLARHDLMLFTNITLQEMAQSIRHLPLTSDIRTKFQYSNVLYATAAYIIERKTGQSLHDFTKERLFTPLNMSETYFSADVARKDDRDISQGYYVDLLGNLVSSPLSVDLRNVRGAGSILTSARDYAKWVTAFLRRAPPLSGAGYAAVLGANTIIMPEPMGIFTTPRLYGMGWFLDTYRGETVIHHEGAQWGWGASVTFLPKYDLGIVILGNNMLGTNAAANVLCYDILDRVIGTPEAERLDWVKITDEAIKNSLVTNATFDALYPKLPEYLLPHPLNLSAYEGVYVHPALPDFRLSADCPERDVPLYPPRWTGARMCAIFLNMPDLPPLDMDFYHITGSYWVLLSTLAGTNSVTRAEFRIDAGGGVSQLGVEADVEMSLQEKKNWWRHASWA